MWQTPNPQFHHTTILAKNRRSRVTGNNGNKTHNDDKQNKKHNAEDYKDGQRRFHKKMGINPYSPRVSTL